MTAHLPPTFDVLIPVAVLVAMAGFVALARRAGASVGPLSLLLGLWFGTSFALGASGVYEVVLADRFPLILVGFGVPILAAIASLRSRWVRSLARRMDLRWLVGLQTLRAGGLVFIVALGLGVLPLEFAGPAGWGDVVVGVTAPAAAVLALRGRRGWWVAAGWNTIGLADLAMALTLGVLGAPTTGNLLGGTPTTEAVSQYPLVLIPTLAVPLGILLHLLTYVRLEGELEAAFGTPPTGPASARAEVAAGGAP